MGRRPDPRLVTTERPAKVVNRDVLRAGVVARINFKPARRI
jgi:hypothetical protein